MDATPQEVVLGDALLDSSFFGAFAITAIVVISRFTSCLGRELGGAGPLLVGKLTVGDT